MDQKTKKDFRAFQFIKNIFSNAAYFVINLVASFWFTPYLKNSLGLDLYGLIPLATSVTNYLKILTTNVSSAGNRFLSVRLHKENVKEANEIFNTTFVITLSIIVISIPISILLIVFSPKLFNVPQNYDRAVQVLFVMTVTAFFVNTLRSNFAVATFHRNRYDLRNIIYLLARLGQIGIVVLLFVVFKPNLFFAGVSLLFSALVGFCGEYFFWRKLTPELKVDFSYFSKSTLKSILNTSLWLLVLSLGYMLYSNIEMVAANRLLPITVAGMYGALITVPNNILAMGGTVNGIWSPAILSKYSRSDVQGVVDISTIAMKLSGLTIALPIGYICGVAGPFLDLWLGPEFVNMKWVMVLMAFPLCMRLTVSPLHSINVIYNKVKIPALVTLMIGILNIVVVFVLGKSFGAIGIALSSVIVITLREVLFTPVYAARLIERPWWIFIRTILKVCVLTLAVGALTFGFVQTFQFHSLVQLFILGLLVSVIYIAVVYFFMISDQEKEIVLGVVQKNLKPIMDKRS